MSKMFNKISRNARLIDFEFKFLGRGHYQVKYTSPVTFKEWIKVINDMPLIDATKNADEPKMKDLNELRRVCKLNFK